jgi:pyruvate formate-lyase activating enzyme-like uncharacterized protein
LKWANDLGVNWINLNELEFSERNSHILNHKNFKLKNDISAGVKGSEESAFNILKKVALRNYDIGVHYCSASFKDGIQLSNRIKRRAKNIVRSHEIISDEGTIIKGVIYTKRNNLYNLYNSIKKEFKIMDTHIYLDEEKERIEIGVWILEEIAELLMKRKIKCYMIEEYPTADRLEVELIPLPL